MSEGSVVLLASSFMIVVLYLVPMRTILRSTKKMGNITANIRWETVAIK